MEWLQIGSPSGGMKETTFRDQERIRKALKMNVPDFFAKQYSAFNTHEMPDAAATSITELPVAGVFSELPRRLTNLAFEGGGKIVHRREAAGLRHIRHTAPPHAQQLLGLSDPSLNER
jgi:hypothetical protein